jgi:TolB-like protein/Tfp pilus assembly protein PilF
MRANERPVDAVAAAILDGTPIDWPDVEAGATEPQRRVLEELRLLCTLADLHRDVPLQPGEAAGPQPDGPRWGRFRLIERLGGGTFGDVYRAWDPRLHREVAVKLIDTDGGPPSAMIREGRLLARVRHPGVVTIYDAEQIGPRLGLSMEFVRGETLEQRLGAKGQYTAAEVIDLGIQLCDALAAVHDAGVLHRDVKASNVVVREDGRIVLMDFGAGRSLAGASGIDAAGTPLYAPPEVFEGREATVRSDLYSVGVLLYRLLTGSYPVQATTLPELREAHSRRMNHAGGDDDLWRGIPRRLAAVIARALDPDPGRRPDSALELAGELRALQEVRARRRMVMSAAAAVLITLAAVSGWALATRDAAVEPLRVAVLPFVVEGDAPETAALRDDLADDLISRLQRSANVRIISKASAFSAAEPNLPLTDVAARLAVSAVVTGRIVKASDMVIIEARLMAVPDERMLWSREYRRSGAELQDLQRSIVADLADTLQLRLVRDAHQWPTRHPEAYALHLRGRAALDRVTPEGTRLALQLFERALALDPDYADVHAALAQLYLSRNSLPGVTAEESFRRGREAGERAMELDPTIPGAHIAAARIKSAQADWAGAERDYLRAIELNPSDVVARQQYAHWLSLLGRPQEALEQAQTAASLDPLSPRALMSVASALRFAKRYEEAIVYARRALEIDPGFLVAFHNLGLNYQGLSRLDEAIENYRRSRPSGNLGHAYAVAGRTAEARALIEQFETEYRTTGLRAGEIAQIYTGLGELDKAFEWLDRVNPYQEGAPTTYSVAPVWDPLRPDARFHALLKRHGLD